VIGEKVREKETPVGWSNASKWGIRGQAFLPHGRSEDGRMGAGSPPSPIGRGIILEGSPSLPFRRSLIASHIHAKRVKRTIACPRPSLLPTHSTHSRIPALKVWPAADP
jgi:hypothetical protein